MTPFAARKKQKKNNLGPIRLGRVTLFGVGFWGFLVLFPLVLFCFFLDQQSEALAATCAQFTWICRETQPSPTNQVEAERHLFIRELDKKMYSNKGKYDVRSLG